MNINHIKKLIMLSTVINTILLWILGTASGLAQNEKQYTKFDETGVRAVTSGFVNTWNHHDMKAFAELFTEDADFVNVIGLWWKGKSEIRKEHEAIHTTRMKNSHLTDVQTVVRFLRPEVAIAHLRWELTGDTGLEGKVLPAREGVLTFVVTKAGSKWLIAGGHNTDIVPIPNVPKEK
jgi:uncharacterized protein (TIGR02246 family)